MRMTLEIGHQPTCPMVVSPEKGVNNCNCGGGGPWTLPNVKYSTKPIPAPKTVDKPAVDINPAMIAGIMPAIKPLAGIIEVPYHELHGERGDEVKLNRTGTKVAFRKEFTVNGHNYLFTSGCCMECIEAKHKKMLRAYLIHHGEKPGSMKLWWRLLWA